MSAAESSVAVRSFVDLREFAASCTAPPSSRWLDGRVALDLVPGPVTVAASTLSGSGNVEALPQDEFVIVLSGALQIESGDSRWACAAGRSIVLPCGLDFHWQAQADTQLIVMGHAGAPGAADPTPIDEAASLEPSGTPLAALLLGPTPSCRNHTDYRSANGEFVCGTWDSTPYRRLAMRYQHHELMHLLDGAVAFEDGAGRRATFAANDVILIERGADCSWRSEVFVKKVYAIYRPS